MTESGGNDALRAQLLDLAEKSQQADTYDTCNCVGCGDDCDCLACVAGVAWRKAYCAVLESGRDPRGITVIGSAKDDPAANKFRAQSDWVPDESEQ